MAILREQIQQAVDKINGSVGTNVAKNALSELVVAFEDGLRQPLNKKENVSDFVTELDATLSTILGFRNNLVNAINDDADEVAEFTINTTPLPSLVSLNLSKEVGTLNVSEALSELDSDDSLSLFECEVGLFDLDDDPSTAYDSLTILVASECASDAELEALYLASAHIHNMKGHSAGINTQMMDNANPVDRIDYESQ